MEGIEILTTKEFAIDFAFNWESALIAGCTILCFCIVLGFLLSLDDYDYSSLVIGVISGIIFGVIIGMLGGVIGQTPTKYETRYQVLISDEVSMNDFLEQYEIVDQEGKIYTVREID